MQMQDHLTREQMADLVWKANAAGFPLNADDEHALCQASSSHPDDWEYLPNLAWDSQDWVEQHTTTHDDPCPFCGTTDPLERMPDGDWCCPRCEEDRQ